MRTSHPISSDISICCCCLNEIGDRRAATHIVKEDGRNWAVCVAHLDAPLPPKPNTTRKAT